MSHHQPLTLYEKQVMSELWGWQQKMQRPPSFVNRLSKKIQGRINGLIPEKIHRVITTTIKQMTRAVIFGAGFTTGASRKFDSWEETEEAVRARIKFYRNTAAAEGAITGAGGILWGLADFPLWLSLKMKMLFEIGALYGYQMKDYKERIFVLYIFQLTFASQQRRNEVYRKLEEWQQEVTLLPESIQALDWRQFQQEYRDYIDLAKMLQLVPGVGAVVGGYVNHRLTHKLGMVAMNAYRMRKIPT